MYETQQTPSDLHLWRSHERAIREQLLTPTKKTLESVNIGVRKAGERKDLPIRHEHLFCNNT